MKPNHKQLFVAAVAAAMGFSSSHAVPQIQKRGEMPVPMHKAPAPAKKGEAATVEALLCSGRTKRRCRKAWPFSGKNKAQRNRLALGFQCI